MLFVTCQNTRLILQLRNQVGHQRRGEGYLLEVELSLWIAASIIPWLVTCQLVRPNSSSMRTTGDTSGQLGKSTHHHNVTLTGVPLPWLCNDRNVPAALVRASSPTARRLAAAYAKRQGDKQSTRERRPKSTTFPRLVARSLARCCQMPECVGRY